ncbi:protein ROOT PRIMORDIUM DEFECTIVE 1 [Cucurbita pepo subsp. pepo]|uniref:protein ROOT PRIMORDIUM DEFECTIVE 1 n=1 Tax=Cucurbita pepo subsp. pepo TaxID=3664 RepID=UPI000C9D5712|nr:protein ROOT PRIMORDIUM DEFECTIVE 1 [Cucurbita pepo subsp. pepo]
MKLFESAFSLSTTDFSRLRFGPFNHFCQRRWGKPAVTAQTRLQDRTRDLKLDKLATQIRKLRIIFKLRELMIDRKRGPFVSLQIMSRWRNFVGLRIGIGDFVHKYPHVFDVFPHPLRRNLCCRITGKMAALMKQEENVINDSEIETVQRLKKLLMMSVNGTLHIHALRLISKELGLPDGFRESILGKYSDDFRLVDLEIVELVGKHENVSVAEVEQWREREFREKWLSEFDVKFAFPINFPTGFKIKGGFREKLRNWQRLPYAKPYEKRQGFGVRSCGGMHRHEKRAVAVLHELLSLTVEKLVDVERLVHFRRDFAIEVNIRELLLKHPGIFYISTKGNTQIVFLREAYAKGFLVEPNPIYIVRRKMQDLLLLGRRHTKQLESSMEIKEHVSAADNGDWLSKSEGSWVLPILQGFD